VQEDHPGFELTLTGTPVLTERFLQRLHSALARGIPAALVAVFMAQWILFRSARRAVAGSLLASWPVAALAVVSAAWGLPVSPPALLAGALVWGVAVQQSTYWLLTLQENVLRKPAEARRRTERTAGRACTASSLILLAEASCGLLSDIPATWEFAFVSSIGLILVLFGVRGLSLGVADEGRGRRAAPATPTVV
jgi:predicted RND superfamily exporter protein